MDSYTQARLVLNGSAKDNMSASSVANDQSNHIKNATDNGIGFGNAAIDGNALALTLSVAEHITVTDAPTFGSLDAGGFRARPSSSVSMWTCCNCYHSGMAVRSTGWCPNCAHEKCGYCQTYKAKGY